MGCDIFQSVFYIPNFKPIKIYGDHHRPYKITDTIILGFYAMIISKPQYLVAAQN